MLNSLNSSLIKACKLGDLTLVEQLLSEGAEVNANHNAPIRQAARKGRAKVIKYLVKKGLITRLKITMPFAMPLPAENLS